MLFLYLGIIVLGCVILAAVILVAVQQSQNLGGDAEETVSEQDPVGYERVTHLWEVMKECINEVNCSLESRLQDGETSLSMDKLKSELQDINTTFTAKMSEESNPKLDDGVHMIKELVDEIEKLGLSTTGVTEETGLTSTITTLPEPSGNYTKEGEIDVNSLKQLWDLAHSCNESSGLNCSLVKKLSNKTILQQLMEENFTDWDSEAEKPEPRISFLEVPQEESQMDSVDSDDYVYSNKQNPDSVRKLLKKLEEIDASYSKERSDEIVNGLMMQLEKLDSTYSNDLNQNNVYELMNELDELYKSFSAHLEEGPVGELMKDLKNIGNNSSIDAKDELLNDIEDFNDLVDSFKDKHDKVNQVANILRHLNEQMNKFPSPRIISSDLGKKILDLTCDYTEFTCRDAKQCYAKAKRCDNIVDCKDGSDEDSCSCKDRLDHQWLCDGYPDCPDGEDELATNCGCAGDEFFCGREDEGRGFDSMCIKKSLVCNGLVECVGVAKPGRDEEDCVMVGPLGQVTPAQARTSGFLHFKRENYTYLPLVLDSKTAHNTTFLDQLSRMACEGLILRGEPKYELVPGIDVDTVVVIKNDFTVEEMEGEQSKEIGLVLVSTDCGSLECDRLDSVCRGIKMGKLETEERELNRALSRKKRDDQNDEKCNLEFIRILQNLRDYKKLNPSNNLSSYTCPVSKENVPPKPTRGCVVEEHSDPNIELICNTMKEVLINDPDFQLNDQEDVRKWVNIDSKLGKESNEDKYMAACGTHRTKERIVGGEVAQPQHWPHTAALYINGQFSCGATIIREDLILTAGHCMYNYNREGGNFYTIRAGMLRKQSSSPWEQHRTVSAVIIHHQYDNVFLRHDLAIGRLNASLHLNSHVQSICLPQNDLMYPAIGSTCIATGWGDLSEEGPSSEELMQGEVPVKAKCSRSYNHLEHQICGGFVRGGKDSCQGDSGGPLYCSTETEGQWFLAGIISHGRGCGHPDEAGVYVRLSYYISWIEVNTNDPS